ncbi:MAG TPA: Crp/Fnr family transcriptional regulator [Puia sp.]|nr:Crp/Fnr family transcriptional regulator [Puia sp.]
MADLRQFCTRFSPLTEEAMDQLLQISTTKTYRKGRYLLKQGQTCKHLFFINSGLVKSFFISGDKEFVMRFFTDNLLFSVFDSFITQTPSKFNLVALEETTVTLINHDALEDLCNKHHCIETLFRKLVSVAAVKMTKRISEMLERDAAERYNQFVLENGDAIQRISLGDIAKYLGITQPSLSRIRANHFLPYGKKPQAAPHLPLSKKQGKNGNNKLGN